jgi:hypothetical protein
MTEKKYKYITIRRVDNETFEGYPVYRVFNNRWGDQLAVLSYYKSWKQYVFSSHDGCVFNDSCLRDVLDFMKILSLAKGKP